MRSKIPLDPPLAKGEDEWFVSEIDPLMPPFRKGGLGDFVHGYSFGPTTERGSLNRPLLDSP